MLKRLKRKNRQKIKTKNLELHIASKQVVLQRQQTFIIAITAIIAFMSLLISSYSVKQTESIFIKENKPVVVISKKQTINNHCFAIWNSGQGVAYNIKVETHLADNISNIGVLWVAEVLDAAMELESKSKTEIFHYHSSSENKSRYYSINPPTVLPPGIENGHSTHEYQVDAIAGLVIKINYKDINDNEFTSCWDGIAWQHFEGQHECLPKYESVHETPVTQFANHLQDLNNSTYVNNLKKSRTNYDFPVYSYLYVDWLKKEASFLKSKNYGDVPNQLEAVLK